MIRNLAKTYANAVVLNLEKQIDRRYFEDFDESQTIVEALFLAHNIPSSALPNTLLFIDEIQESPKAIQLLRYFYEEIPGLHVIRVLVHC